MTSSSDTGEQWAKRAADAQTLDESLRLFEQGLDAHPDNIDLLSGLADLLEEVGEIDPAEGLYRRLIHLDPDNTNHRFNLALLLENHREDFAEAAQMYRAVLAANPADAEALAAYGALALASGDIDAAEDHLRRALDADGTAYEVRYNLANLLQNYRGKPKEAEALYLDVLEFEPEDVDVNGALAELRIMQGDLSGAIPLLAVALDNLEQDAAQRAPLTFLSALAEVLTQRSPQRTLDKLTALLTAGVQDPDWELTSVYTATRDRLGERASQFARLVQQINDLDAPPEA